MFLYLIFDKLFNLSVYFLAETSDLSPGRKFWSSGIKLFLTDILFVEIFTKIPTHGSLRTGIHDLLHVSTRLVVVVIYTLGLDV